METLKEFIKHKRPNLSKQSVNTYASILKNLYIRVFGDDNIDINNFSKSKDILNDLKTISPNKRKTVLSALVIITDIPEYRNQMLKDIDTYTEDQHKQEKSEKQQDSWVDGDEIKMIYDKLAKEAKLLYKKEHLTMSDLQTIQNYVILSLLGGIYIPPRRSKDYVDFKIHDIDKGHDNYMLKEHFIFNSYKTAKTYGRQMVAIPKELKTLTIRENDRSSNFVAPSFSQGCYSGCIYCYARRHNPDSFSTIKVSTNVDSILEKIKKHSDKLGIKVPDQVDSKYWVYEISMNSDFSNDSKFLDWVKIFDFFGSFQKLLLVSILIGFQCHANLLRQVPMIHSNGPGHFLL